MDSRSNEGRSRLGLAAWIAVVVVMGATAVFVPLRIIYKQNQTVKAAPNGVVIANFAFSPTPLKVPAGTVVTFKNTDGAVHTATASDKSFDSGHLDQGATYKAKITKSVTYFCNIHQYMTGSIEVTS